MKYQSPDLMLEFVALFIFWVSLAVYFPLAEDKSNLMGEGQVVPVGQAAFRLKLLPVLVVEVCLMGK